jgi:DNA polymerase/3'-5' exonuclease PolX
MNREIVDSLRQLAKFYNLKGDKYRASTFEKAASTIDRKVKEEITLGNYKKLLNLPGIGEGVRRRVEELLQTGSLSEMGLVSKEAKSSPEDIRLFTELTSVYGIGPAKARSLIEQGITSLDDLMRRLREKRVSLTAAQRLGLKYYHALQRKIPRGEITQFGGKIISLIRDFYSSPIRAEIVGSYRRGALESGDIDILFSAPESRLEEIVEYLHQEGYIRHILSLGRVKFQGIYFSAAPAWSHLCQAHKIDIRYVPLESWPTALLHATGSDKFNIHLRQEALKQGYKLSEHGLFREERAKEGEEREKEGEIRVPVRNEEDVFKRLGLEYVPPEERSL